VSRWRGFTSGATRIGGDWRGEEGSEIEAEEREPVWKMEVGWPFRERGEVAERPSLVERVV
jgi:hypothetical protein